MKTKNLFWAAIACTALLSACKDDEKEEIIPVSFSEFGFYAEDNSDWLKADYVAEDLTGTTLSFTLPYGTDPEAVKSLSPRFVATEGAEVNVADETGTPAGEALVSGVSTVDFSSDVILVISLKNNYKAYTVSVKIAEPAKWTQVATSAVDMEGTPALGINPKDGSVYIAGAMTDTEHDSYPVLLKYDSGALTDVAGFLAQGSSDHFAMTFDPDGIPYVTFYDASSYNEAALKKQVVMKIENGTASYVGDPTSLYTTTHGSYISTSAVFAFGSNDVWCAHYNNTRNVAVARKEMNLAHFDGSIWTTANLIDGRGTANTAYTISGKTIDDVPYLFVYNQNSNSVSLYSYESKWTAVFESVVLKKEDGEAEATINLLVQDFDIASDGKVYVLTGADFSSKEYDLALVCIDPESSLKQTIIGGVTNVVVDRTNGCKGATVALDSNDMPYIAYASGSAYVMHIDSDTKKWSTPEVLLSSECDYLRIVFTDEGKGYIAVHEDSDISQEYHLFSNE